MDNMDNQELISALADGQLRGAELAIGVAAAAGTAEGRARWHAYHVVGDALRSGRAPVVATPPEVFLARLQQRLQQEAVPQQSAPVAAIQAQAAARPAANDSLWKLVAGFASVAAVAAVGWNMYGATGTSAQPQLASGPGAGTAVQAQAMIRDPRLDQLMQAHRQLGGASALQTPSGFLRNATFEGPAR